MGDGSEETISLQEWQGWGTMSPLPKMVAEIVEDLKVLERDIDSQMSFGGNGGKLQVLPLICCIFFFFQTGNENNL